LEIDFSSHLNVLTGETGAGKSIIVGALDLILGQRADSATLLNRERKCIVELCVPAENLQNNKYLLQLLSFLQKYVYEYCKMEIAQVITDCDIMVKALLRVKKIHNQLTIDQMKTTQRFGLSILQSCKRNLNVIQQHARQTTSSNMYVEIEDLCRKITVEMEKQYDCIMLMT